MGTSRWVGVGVVVVAGALGCPTEDPPDVAGTTGSPTTSPGSSGADTTGADGDDSADDDGTTAATTDDPPSTDSSSGDDSDTDVDPPLFDVGTPDIPAMPPPVDYGTTPLEQVWYLTNNASNDILIDFTTDPATVTCEGVVGSSVGFEGTAVFTRPDTGQLLFYTDGNSVLHGQTHNPVANGTGLNGDSSCTEAALITPFPGEQDIFYIFTNATNATASSSVYYSIIDLTMGLDGTVTTKNQLLTTGNPGEALDVLPHANGEDFWVLTYESATTVLAYRVDAAGVAAAPITSNTTFTGQVLRSSINHSEDYQRIVATAHQGGGCGFISTADFDPNSGMLSNFVKHVDDCAGTGYQASLSPDASKIYYVQGAEGYNGTPWQYDIDTSSAFQLSTTGGFGASKLAPDDKVYFVGYSKTSLGVVNDPDAAAALADFQVDGLPLQGCTSGYSVPNQTSSFLEFLIPEG